MNTRIKIRSLSLLFCVVSLTVNGFSKDNTIHHKSVKEQWFQGDTIAEKLSDSVAKTPRRIKPKQSFLTENAMPQIGLLGYADLDDDDQRVKIMNTMVENGDLLKFRYLYIPMQPYGVELLRQYVTTGDTFSKSCIGYLYGENDESASINEQLDSMLTKWRNLYVTHEAVAKNWVWKSSFPKIRDYERGYSLACKNLLTHSVVPPNRIKYQVDALISNAMFTYYDEMSDTKEDMDVDAAYSIVGTFYTFAKAYDTLKNDFKSWLPADQFEHFNEMVEMYLMGDRFFGKKSHELFLTLDRRATVVKEIVNSSKISPVLLIAPAQDIVVNDKKMGIPSYLKELLNAGVQSAKIHRWIQYKFDEDNYSNKLKTDYYLLEDTFSVKVVLAFPNDTSKILVVDESIYIPATYDENWQNIFFLESVQGKSKKELITAMAIADTTYSNSFVGYTVADAADSVKVPTTFITTKRFADKGVYSPEINEGIFDEEYVYDGEDNTDIPNVYDAESIPKMRHSNVQLGMGVENTFFQLNKKNMQVMNDVLGRFLPILPGTSIGTLNYQDVKFSYLSSSLHQRNVASISTVSLGVLNAKIYGISGDHFGYNNFTEVALDKKRRRFSVTTGNSLDYYQVKLSIPEAGVSTIDNPLVGKSISSKGTSYGLSLGLKMRLGSFYVGGSGGYSWDLGKGDWFQGKQVIYGLPSMKFTGWQYRLEAGFKIGIIYKKNKKESEDRD